MRSFPIALLSLAVLVLPAAASGTKHVVAPPSDFPLLRLPDPAATAQRSHSALVPVRLAARGDGRFGAEVTLPLDDPDGSELVVFAPRPGSWEVLVATETGPRPLAELAGAAATGAGPRVLRTTAALPFARDARAVDVYRFERTGPGPLALAIDAAEDWNPGDEADGFLGLEGRRDLELETRLLHFELTTGRELGLAARLSDASAPGAMLESALLRLTPPGGVAVELPMTPAPDGGFEARFTASLPGTWLAQVDATGRTPEGHAFRRTTQTLFPVSGASAELLGARGELRAAADGPLADPGAGAERLALAVAVRLEGASRVQLGGFLHGADGTPVAFVGRIADVPAGAGEVEVELDLGWLAAAGVAGALELRDVRLQDVDSHAVLARAASLPVAAASLAPLPAAPGPFGPIPRAALDPNPSLRTTRPPKPPVPSVPGLMLVHGYCSGGVWPAADFTGDASFADFDANRSHDEFALLLRDQADAAFDTYGVVAHSQGGAAALHLLTFYESGLDGAQGDRLIQSVGTPYQGTPLAGSLASLAQSLGIGCGPNADLDPDGAALWLANVPSAPRARVHYWTTSPAPGAGACQGLVGLFLTDPEDGTTEMFRGQLPGASSMGHDEGWCHTTGMNFPPQYLDHARNADMDLHAAR